MEKALEKSPKSPLAPLSVARGSKSSNTLSDRLVDTAVAGAEAKTSARKSFDPALVLLDWEVAL